MTRIAFFLALLALAACGSTGDAFREGLPDISTPEAVHRVLDDKTAKSYSLHGTQIEYLAADGRTWLWYPGNVISLPGRWMLQQSGSYFEICFEYGPDSYNPLTLQVGGWECGSLAGYLGRMDEIVDGDPLKLRRGIPFILPRGVDLSIEEALAQAKAR